MSGSLLNRFPTGNTRAFREGLSPGYRGVPVLDWRFYIRNVPVRVNGEAIVGVGEIQEAATALMAHPPRTRPDRHLRQLSCRRLTNWLLNYWATWPVIASYLTSTGYIRSWILRFEEYRLVFPYASILYALFPCVNDDSYNVHREIFIYNGVR